MKNTTTKRHRLLKRMSQIKCMERGTLCRLTGRAQYNHQTWQNGRNIVRYVPADQVDALRQAIAGYRLFMDLAQAYADQTILQTRRQSRNDVPPKKPSRRKK